MSSKFSLVILGVLLSFGVLYAAREVNRFQSGPCENGKEWWSVTKYVNGQACEVYGINCDGVRYSRDLHCRVVDADPTGGIHTETETGSDGSITWYARLRYDEQQRVSWIGGKNLDGEFYEADISYDDSAPAPGEGLQ